MPKSLTSPIRLEPVSRYLFRRAGVVPALAGMALCVAMPCMVPAVEAQGIKGDSGSLGPIVSILTPEYSQVLKGETRITLGIQPRSYPAESVELLVDGRSITGAIPVQNSFKWKTELFVDGPHTLTVRVTDTQGYVGQAETNVFINNDKKRVDVTAPILNWANIQNGAKLSGEVKVRLDARDDFGVKYVFLRLNSAITPDAKPALASWMTNRPPYEFKLDTSKYADGLYVLDAYTWDDQENEESAPRLTVGFYNHGLNATTAAPVVVDTVPDESTNSELPPIDKSPTPTNKNASPKGNDAANKAGNNGTRVANGGETRPALPPMPTVSGAFPTSPPVVSSGSAGSVSTEHRGGSNEYVSLPPVTRRENAAVRPAPRIAELDKPRNAAPASPSISSGDAPLSTPTISSAPTGAYGVLPGQRPAPVATQPAIPQRFATTIQSSAAKNPSGASSQSGIATVISGGQESGVLSTRTSFENTRSESTRIASVLPGEMATPPAQTIWRNGNKVSPSHSVSRSSTAFATTLPTSPSTNVATGRGATLDASRDQRPQIQTAPLAVGVLPRTQPAISQPLVSQPETSAAPGTAVQSTPDAPAMTTVEREATDRITQSAAPVLSAAPVTEKTAASNLMASLPPAPAALKSKTERLVALASSTSATTRISAAPTQPLRAIAASTASMPTLPRVAMSPNFNSNPSTPKANAAIVVSPTEKIETTSFVAVREESLAAIANRFKMPLSVVAAANGLNPNARIVKGTKLSIPRSLQVSYKGQAVTGDVAPLLIGKTSVGAFRFLFEQQGGKLSWDAEKQQVTAKNDKYEVTLTIGSDVARVNEKEEMMDMAAFLLSGRTMVPIRFFESALNAQVEWDPSTGRIYVAATQ